MVTRADIQVRIKSKMDHLQQLMESNAHLSRNEYVLSVIEAVGKYFTAMSEEDKEYLQIARSVVEDKKEWK